MPCFRVILEDATTMMKNRIHLSWYPTRLPAKDAEEPVRLQSYTDTKLVDRNTSSFGILILSNVRLYCLQSVLYIFVCHLTVDSDYCKHITTVPVKFSAIPSGWILLRSSCKPFNILKYSCMLFLQRLFVQHGSFSNYAIWNVTNLNVTVMDLSKKYSAYSLGDKITDGTLSVSSSRP